MHSSNKLAPMQKYKLAPYENNSLYGILCGSNHAGYDLGAGDTLLPESGWRSHS